MVSFWDHMKSVLKTIKKKKKPSEGLVTGRVLAQSERCRWPLGPLQHGHTVLVEPGLPAAPGRPAGPSWPHPQGQPKAVGSGLGAAAGDCAEGCKWEPEWRAQFT